MQPINNEKSYCPDITSCLITLLALNSYYHFLEILQVNMDSISIAQTSSLLTCHETYINTQTQGRPEVCDSCIIGD